MNYKNFLKSDFWFSVDPVRIHLSDKIFFIVGAAFVVLSIILKIFLNKIKNPFDREITRKFVSVTFVTGLLEVLWFGVRYENAAFLGVKAVATAIALAWIIRILYLLKIVVFKRKAATEAWEKDVVKQKYLNQ